MKSTNLEIVKPDIQLIVFDINSTLDDETSIPLLDSAQSIHDTKGIKTILATDQTGRDAEDFITALSKKGYNFVDDYVCLATFRCYKDSNKFWPSLIEKFKVSAQNILFVDDLKENLKKSQEFGISSISATNKNWAAAELRNKVSINSL